MSRIYREDAFEAFQSTEKARELSGKMAGLENGAVKSSKSRQQKGDIIIETGYPFYLEQ